MKIYVGSVNYGISFKIYRQAAGEGEYEVEEIWPGDYDDTFAPLRSLALLRTTTPIEYRLNARCISLPKDYYIVWKYSFTIPNNAEFTSSLWCLDQVSVLKDYGDLSKEVALSHKIKWHPLQSFFLKIIPSIIFLG